MSASGSIVRSIDIGAALRGRTAADVDAEIGNQFQRFGFPDGGTHTGNRQRAAHLKRLEQMRSGYRPGPNNKLGWAGGLLSIPELDYYVLTHRFPDLSSPDHEIKRRAWLKFFNSSLSEPYRMQRRRRAGSVRNVVTS